MNFNKLDKTLKHKINKLLNPPRTKETFFIRYIPKVVIFMLSILLFARISPSRIILDLIIIIIYTIATAIFLFTPIFYWFTDNL